MICTSMCDIATIYDMYSTLLSLLCCEKSFITNGNVQCSELCHCIRSACCFFFVFKNFTPNGMQEISYTVLLILIANVMKL